MKATAIETMIKPIDVTVIRPVDSIIKDILFDGAGNASFKKGAKTTVEDLATVAAEWNKEAQSKTIRTANVLRLARQLPALKVKEGEKEHEISAFDACKIHFRRMVGDNAFYNMFQLVSAIDTTEALKLQNVSPFVMKENMGLLKKAGALKEMKDGTLQLGNGDGEKAQALVEALKSGKAPVNKIRETAKALKVALNPPAPILSDVEKAAKAEKEKKEAAEAEKERYKPEHVARDLKTVIGVWERSVDLYTVQAVREACRSEIIALATLAGFDVTPKK